MFYLSFWRSPKGDDRIQYIMKQKILDDLKQAMKERNQEKISVLRMLKSEIKNEEIAKMKKEEGLSCEEVVTVIQRMVKQRKDAAGQFEAGGRPELAAKERAEIKILEEYLPEQLSDDELKAVIQKTIDELGTSGPINMGKVMGVIMGQVRGRADGNRVKTIVCELLKK